MRPNPPQTSRGCLRILIGQCSNHKYESDIKKKDPPQSSQGNGFYVWLFTNILQLTILGFES